MRPINVEITMGHNIGISASYYKPTEQEVLEDYLKAVDLLTINGNEQKLSRQVAELQDKNKNSESKQIKSLTEKYDSEIQILKEAIYDMQTQQKQPEKLLEIDSNNKT